MLPPSPDPERDASAPCHPAARSGAAGVGGEVGQQVGGYRILELIGEGGFGAVYLAEQREPVRRRVALKVVKPGMDTAEVLARFEAERQALAMMDHPNVAKVFDAGATASGRPFFAMEYVPGVSLTRYCDQHRLTIRERLELFVAVCAAVQHAHTKGIIHRDLKPANILVTLADAGAGPGDGVGGRPVPKVIDFGIAKATTGSLTGRTLHTGTGSLIGTPEYMSPEQACTNGLDVDARTDVYALGVVLYELLTGVLPFASHQLRAGGHEAMVAILRDAEPPRPSTHGAIDLDDIASLRRTDAPALRRALRGDLDWIVLKALAKDRTHRYETANALAMDVHRHLGNEAVLARPPSTLYLLSRFARRHRTAVAVAGTAVVLLVAGTVSTSIGFVRARAAERDAVLAAGAADAGRRDAEAARAEAVAAREAEAALRAVAERESAANQAVTTFLTSLISLTNPDAVPEPSMSVLDLLRRAAAQAGQAFRDQPRAEARVRLALGQAFHAVQEHEDAMGNLRRAETLLRAHDPEALVERFVAVRDLRDAAFGLNSDEVLGAGVRCAALAAAIVATQDERLGGEMQAFAEALRAGRITAALAEAERVFATAESTLPADHPAWQYVFDLARVAAHTYGGREQYEPGLRWAERLVRIVDRSAVAGSVERIKSRLDLAWMLLGSGDWARAEAEVRAAMPHFERTQRAGGVVIANLRTLLGEAIHEQGRHAEAETELRQAIDVLHTRRGHRLALTATTFRLLIAVSVAQGKRSEAAIFRERLASLCLDSSSSIPWHIARTAVAPEHDAALAAASALERTMTVRTDDATRFAAWRSYRAAVAAGLPDGHVDRALLAAYANFWADIGEDAPISLRAEITADARAVLRLHRGFRGIATWNVLWESFYHAMRERDFAAAEAFAREAWEGARVSAGPESLYASLGQSHVGQALAGQRRFDEAEPLLRESFLRLRDAISLGNGNTRTALGALVDLHMDRGRPEAAVPLIRDCVEATRFVPAAVIDAALRGGGGEVAAACTRLAGLLPIRAERLAAAMAARDTILRSLESAEAPIDDQVAMALGEWARSLLHRSRGRENEAALLHPVLVACEGVRRRLFGSHGEPTLQMRQHICWALRDAGRLDEAEQLARTLLAEETRLGSATPRRTLHAVVALGAILVRARKWGDAAQLLDAHLDALAAEFEISFLNMREVFQALLAFPPSGTDAAFMVRVRDWLLARLDEAARDPAIAGDYARYAARTAGRSSEIHSRALIAATAAAAAEPAAAGVLTTLALAQLRTGDAQSAVATIARAAATTPAMQSSAAHVVLALACHQLGDGGKAREHLQRARDLIGMDADGDHEPGLFAEAEALLGRD